MKPLFFISLMIVFYPLVASGQSGSCETLISEARSLIRNRQFDDAFKKIEAAKGCAKQQNIDYLYEQMFAGLKRQAKDEKNAKNKAKEEEKNALQAKALADTLLVKAVDQRKRADSLSSNARMLEANLLGGGEEYRSYLLTIGLGYFKFDTVDQSRDYRNALTYFSVAKYLDPNKDLDNLIDASKLGIAADEYFVAGRLDSARQKYEAIQRLLADNVDYETWRIKNIEDVENLFKAFCQKYKTSEDSVLVEGNWWTIPEQFRSFAGITHITLKNNHANWKNFPKVLDSLYRLKSLVITDYPNIRKLQDWKELTRLQSITLTDNLNLSFIEGLDSLEQLTTLNISNCPALRSIQGCRRLHTFSIQNSPQAMVSFLISDNLNLHRLSLADLPETNFNTENLVSLDSLNLANMADTSIAKGLSKNRRLRVLIINNLDNLKNISLPDGLKEVCIKNCDGLARLDNWPPSENLDKIILYNNSITKLLDWRTCPNIRYLLIQNNNNLLRTGSIRSLKKADRLFIINNSKINANTLNIGLSIDFFRLEGFKIEFEPRNTFNTNIAIRTKFSLSYHTVSDSISRLDVKYRARAIIPGVVLTYYSPFHFYYGTGLGIADLRQRQTSMRNNEESTSHTFHFTWINSLGYQVASFFRNNKLSFNLDLNTVFKPGEIFSSRYVIFVSPGIIYSHTLGFSKKTRFIRPRDDKQYIRLDKQKIPVKELPERF